jgi:hypothetical protein
MRLWERIRAWLCRKFGWFCKQDPLGPVENARVEIGESDDDSDSEMGSTNEATERPAG